MKFVLFSFVFIGCSLSQMSASDVKDKKEVDTKITNNATENEISPNTYEVYNGKLKFISFTLLPKEESKSSGEKIICKEQGSSKPLIKSIPFISDGQSAKLYYAESYHSQAKKHFCYSLITPLNRLLSDTQ